MSEIKRLIVDVPDFPKPGILFRDITPLLRSHFDAAMAALEALYSAREWEQVNALAGIESRGFILGAGLAARLKKGFVVIRKQGKLPPPVVSTGYALEYGSGVLEMQPGAGRVLIVDDVLATGGTAAAVSKLVENLGGKVVGLGFVIELTFLNGRAKLPGYEIRALLNY